MGTSEALAQLRQIHKKKPSVFMEGFGGAEGDRTPDLVNAIHALSQLSYSPALIKTENEDPHQILAKIYRISGGKSTRPSRTLNLPPHFCTFSKQEADSGAG